MWCLILRNGSLPMRKRKMAAPVIVTVIAVLYYTAYFGFLISVAEGIWKWLLGLLPLVLSVLMIWVCAERIKEIKEGEEDDLGQY